MDAMPHRHHPHHRQALGIALVLILIWGGNFTMTLDRKSVV